VTDRLKVKFLVAIWGAKYIQEFARVSLPSYLAEGNLPAIAAEANLEVLVMTSADSQAEFDAVPMFARLRAICPVRFILIDDLITSGNYGVTLTLAYARGIRDSGEEQTNTHFVFMNADFVLADGSLRSLVGKLKAGHRCVMAPSLRAISEQVLPPIAAQVDASGVLSVPPRALVDLTLRNLHPTVIGKTVTQDLCTCRTHNQIYWQVDEHTLLGRYHLIFMLAIKPEVPIGAVNSYCDYGFVPELVPSGDFTIMDDSDGFFMLELQTAAQEKQLVRGGTSTSQEVAAQLAEWTTKEHRRLAEMDVVFRAGEIPANLEGARRDFARYFQRLRGLMRGAPKDHADHIYWTLGVQSWELAKFGAVPHKMPPELGGGEVEERRAVVAPRVPLPRRISASVTKAYVEFLARAHKRAGSLPNVPIWHHQWLDSRLVQVWLAGIGQAKGQRNLLLCREDSVLVPFFSGDPGFEVDKRLGQLIGETEVGSAEIEPKGRYDNIFVHMLRADMRRTAMVLDSVRRMLDSNGRIAVFVEHRFSETDPSNFSVELAQYVDEILPSDWLRYRVAAKFAGGHLKRWLRLTERRLVRDLFPSSLLRLPALGGAFIAWPFIALLTAINNLANRKATEDCPEFCSSFLLSLEGPTEQSESKPVVSVVRSAKQEAKRGVQPAAVEPG
jgi:hypothetical protein